MTAVNEAINEMYVNDEEYDALTLVLTHMITSDQSVLAQKIEKHDLIEFRHLQRTYTRVINVIQNVALSKEDKMYKDAINATEQQ